MTAIRKHLVDFLAIIGLIIVSLAVASVILANQRLALPAWVPVLGQDFTEVEAELSSAQAVTPGQGQTVNVAGVEVGEISAVRLEGGKAIVTLKLEEDSVPVYNDASVLLRPKTGLKDMVAELTPGTEEAGELEEGQRIPIGQTLPDVNLDEILASLDGDTRTYLQLLLSDGGEALGGNGRALANTIRRFEPTARDTRKIAEQLVTRRRNIKRVTTRDPPADHRRVGGRPGVGAGGRAGRRHVCDRAAARADRRLLRRRRQRSALLRGAAGLRRDGRGRRRVSAFAVSLRPAGLEGHGRAAQPDQLRGRRRPRDHRHHAGVGRVRPGHRTPRGGVRAVPEAGYDHLALISAGPDVDAFLAFFESELRDRLRA